MDMFNVRFPSLTERSAKVDTILWLNYLYVLSKFVDLLDTIFFVLRKKQCQVTGLHVYHHLTVPFIAWSYFRLCGTNTCVIPFELLNSTVHAIMYSYYGLAAIGPWMQPYLWWKRYITQLQIAQFVLLFLYAIYFVAFQRGYDFFYSFNLISQSLLYIYLFSSFYFVSYKQKSKCQKSDINNNNLHNSNGFQLSSKAGKVH